MRCISSLLAAPHRSLIHAACLTQSFHSPSSVYSISTIFGSFLLDGFAFVAPFSIVIGFGEKKVRLDACRWRYLYDIAPNPFAHYPFYWYLSVIFFILSRLCVLHLPCPSVHAVAPFFVFYCRITKTLGRVSFSLRGCFVILWVCLFHGTSFFAELFALILDGRLLLLWRTVVIVNVHCFLWLDASYPYNIVITCLNK